MGTDVSIRVSSPFSFKSEFCTSSKVLKSRIRICLFVRIFLLYTNKLLYTNSRPKYSAGFQEHAFSRSTIKCIIHVLKSQINEEKHN